MSLPYKNPRPRGGCGDPGDPIDFGCVFDGTAYQSFTPSAEQADRTKWSFAARVKKCAFGVDQTLFYTSDPSDGYSSQGLYLSASDGIGFGVSVGSNYSAIGTVAKQRDPAATFDLVAHFDSSNVVGPDRMRIYINAVRQDVVSTGSAAWPFAQGLQGFIGTTQEIRIAQTQYVNNYWLDAVLSDVHFQWGDFIDPLDYSRINRYGVPVPQKLNINYGAIGAHLDFADPLDLGADVSGNGNHFTPVNMTAENQTKDTPTNNTARLSAVSPNGTVSETATVVVGGYNQHNNIPCNMALPSNSKGRYTARFVILDYGDTRDSRNISAVCSTGATYIIQNLSAQEMLFGSTQIGYMAVNDLVDMTLDFDADAVEVRLNGELLHTEANAGLAQGDWTFVATTQSSSSRAPATIKCTFDAIEGEEISVPRLPCPAIKKPENYYDDPVTVDGEPITGKWDMANIPTAVLSKREDAAGDWLLSVSTRPGKAVVLNSTAAEVVADGLTFTNDGATLGVHTALSGTVRHHCWRAASCAGLDIVEFDHVNGTPTTVPHNAGGQIDHAWIIPLDGGARRAWWRAAPSGTYAEINQNTGNGVDADWFAGTANDVTLGAQMATGTYLALVWRGVGGFSAFIEYVGNGAADGPDVYLGFVPALFMGRRLSTYSWLQVSDQNPVTKLQVMSDPAASYESYPVDCLSYGAKLRTANGDMNPSGDSVYVAAWAKTPFKFANAQ